MDRYRRVDKSRSESHRAKARAGFRTPILPSLCLLNTRNGERQGVVMDFDQNPSLLIINATTSYPESSKTVIVNKRISNALYKGSGKVLGDGRIGFQKQVRYWAATGFRNILATPASFILTVVSQMINFEVTWGCTLSWVGFFGVYDGHGGRKAAEFVVENLHDNIFKVLKNCTEKSGKEEAVKAGYLKTNQEFFKTGSDNYVISVPEVLFSDS
ncbi:protein phosphatase 2C family protein [Actinidia rufa]|uniref:Protein phosphatase 2C family protein n=1 Tax=Actinidia rufa TaxID=165716 RepID=A0A7J0EUL7_9ERIC|nr:protein phosphatase 2C family protein [Actinidia rufa]